MSRGVNVSLLVPVILGLVIAVLLYFCWGTRSLSHRLREEDAALKRELTGVRNERDNYQYRVNLLADQLQQCKTGREEEEKLVVDCEDRAAELSQKLESEQSRVSQCEGDVRQFQERAGQLQSESTQLSSEVASLQQRVRSCEDSLPDLQAKADVSNDLLSKNSQLQSGVQLLQQNNEQLNQQNSELNGRLQRAELQLAECALGGRPGNGAALPGADAQLPAVDRAAGGFELPAAPADNDPMY